MHLPSSEGGRREEWVRVRAAISLVRTELIPELVWPHHSNTNFLSAITYL
jgi:hypothetical protein